MLRTTLLHSGWQFACQRWLGPPRRLGHSELEWLSAQVPGHIHLDLMRHGIIADPYRGFGELGCQWVDEQDWSYRTQFAFEPDPALPGRLLRFEGLDTVCTVSLNGQAVARHDNMFVPLQVDVSGRLQRGNNELRVDFESAARVGRERRQRYLEGEQLPDSVARFDERAFVRKAQYMFGWDWSPRLVSVGIWRPVALVEYAGRLVDVHVIQQHLADGSVELRLLSEVQGAGEAVHFIEGVEEVVRDGQAARIERPERWWPAGLGAQRLYEVTTVLAPPGVTDRAELKQMAHDRRVIRVGLRTLRLLREPDSWGESFEFEVNGQRLWALGANWIPDDSFPSVVTRSRLQAQLEKARDLGMNMLRVWGGGLYESDDFYELCDELGLLLWQDFAYACSHYPDDRQARQAAREEAGVNVRRLRNHPSLALWCGNNENRMLFHKKWGSVQRQPGRYYGEAIYESVLPELLASLDPGRPYIPSSPCGGEEPNCGGIGDQHCWDVWHGRGDWKYYADSTGRFVSEFGFAAAPGVRTWRRMVGDMPDLLALDPRHPVARWHDKTGKGYERFLGLAELHYPPATDLAEWIYYSQLNQRDALRHGFEHYRCSEFCRGALLWQLNDCWPVQSWAVIDSEGEYKAAAYELRRLLAPLLVAIERDGSRVRLWITLDNAPDAAHGQAVLEARSLLDGQLLARHSSEFGASPGSRRIALEVELEGLELDETIVSGSFLGRETFQLLAEPKAARLVAPHLVAWSDAPGLVIQSDVPVVDLMVWDEGGQLRLYDNFVTLAAGGRTRLRTSGTPTQLRARSLQGVHAVEFVTVPKT
jgi:beta-mannosidase